MNYFSKNLEYLTKTKVNQNQLSTKLDLSRQCISGYLKQGKEPKYDTLIKIAEIYLDIDNKNNQKKNQIYNPLVSLTH